MAAATQTRAEQIDEYVLRDAWSSLLVKIATATDSDNPEQGGPLDDLLSTMFGENMGPLERELWPDLDDEVPENERRRGASPWRPRS